LTFAPKVLAEWMPPLAVAEAIPFGAVPAIPAAAAAVVADAAVAGAVSETPITCSSDSSKLLNRPWFVVWP
jgi:hypothetical protein